MPPALPLAVTETQGKSAPPRRQVRKSLTHYADRHAGRPPTAAERAHLALFPTDILNPDGRRALSYTWFHTGFRSWIADLDLSGHYVAHQARHTLATRLLRHGATLSTSAATSARSPTAWPSTTST